METERKLALPVMTHYPMVLVPPGLKAQCSILLVMLTNFRASFTSVKRNWDIRIGLACGTR